MGHLALEIEEPRRLEHDNLVRMHSLGWRDLQQLLAIRGEHSTPRICYLNGEAEIMSPSRSREAIKSLLGRLVEAYCLEREIPFRTLGSWTLESEPDERAIEPDECFILGEADADRPQLAIEVIWTSGGLDKLEIYRKLDVAEVWIWQHGLLLPDALSDQHYKLAEASLVLPGLDLEQLSAFLEQPTTYHAIRAYRAALGAEG